VFITKKMLGMTESGRFLVAEQCNHQRPPTIFHAKSTNRQELVSAADDINHQAIRFDLPSFFSTTTKKPNPNQTMTMKKTLLSTLILMTASLAYAGSACCGAGGDKKDEAKPAELSEALAPLAKTCGGGGCGDKAGDGEAMSTDGNLLAKDCGGSCGDKGDAKSMTLSGGLLAKDCGGSCGDKGDKSLTSGLNQLA
jgi:hypothetical protein